MTKERNQVKAVIFDMDGLLIDSEVIWYQLYQELLKPYGKGFTVEDYGQKYSGKIAIENLRAIVERFELPISPEEGLEKIVGWEQKYLERGVDLKKGARELLVYLKENQYKIALATSSVKERAVGILKKNEIEGFFDEMVFGPEVKRGKPYPDVFLQAAEKLKEKSEHCLVLEDSEAGIQASYAAGIPVICIPDMKRPGEAYAEKTEELLDSLLEVIEFLKYHQNLT